MKIQKEEGGSVSRRRYLEGVCIASSGGIAGRISNTYAAPAPTPAPAPPLPWKWTKLDPLEAGRRAYRAYLSGGG